MPDVNYSRVYRFIIEFVAWRFINIIRLSSISLFSIGCLSPVLLINTHMLAKISGKILPDSFQIKSDISEQTFRTEYNLLWSFHCIMIRVVRSLFIDLQILWGEIWTLLPPQMNVQPLTCERIIRQIYSEKGEKNGASYKLTHDKGFTLDSKAIFCSFSFGALSMGLLTNKYG